jgi:glycosyltransferase involved in cell wall biosynthesis
MNWASYASESWQGRSYGQKSVEFARFLGLPERVAPTEIEIAGRGMGYGEVPGSATDPDGTSHALLASKGFRLADASVVCPDFESYRSYIASSKAEWSVAKNGYVTGQSGWFSCRSACYLAAGKPVVVQDTGFGHVLPVGEGILPFTNLEQAVDGIRQVESAYERHARAAREIAEQYFDSDKVLHRLIDVACNRTAEGVQSRAMRGSV